MSQAEENRRLNALELRQGKTVLESKPLQINFELIGICNIVPPCLYCTGKNLGYNYAPLDVAYLDGYSNFIQAAEHLNEDSFGEPLLHKKLTALAQQVTARGQRFSFVTNGILLYGTRAQELAKCGERLGFHVSFNAASEETYYRLHGKPFDKLISNVRNYVDLYRDTHDGATPDLVATFIVMNVNRREIFDFVDLTHGLGVKALFAQLHNRASVPIGDFGYQFVFENELLSPSEYFEVGEQIRCFTDDRGFDRNRIILQWDPVADFAVSSFKRQTESLAP